MVFTQYFKHFLNENFFLSQNRTKLIAASSFPFFLCLLPLLPFPFSHSTKKTTGLSFFYPCLKVEPGKADTVIIWVDDLELLTD